MSFAALALRARAANDTTRAQINNIPSKSHVIPLKTKAPNFSRPNFSYTNIQESQVSQTFIKLRPHENVNLGENYLKANVAK